MFYPSSGRARRGIFLSQGSVVALALSGALYGFSAQAGAASAEVAAADYVAADEAFDHVTVTAQRRETALMKTPIAVNAVTEEVLQQQAVRRLNDLAGLAAGVNIPNQTLANQAIFIRGVGTAIASANPSVGVYIDEIYIPRPIGLGWYGSLPDIEQVEILHGPQGTLYGQSSSAGALKLNSRRPTDEFRGLVEGGIGNDHSYEGRAYVSGGIVPGVLAGSIATAYVHRGGPDENPYLGRKVGKIDNLQIRGILSYTPSDSFDARFSIDYMRDRGEYRTAAPINRPDGGLRVTFSDIDPSQPYDGLGGNLQLNFHPSDNITIRSITGIRGFDTTTPVDSDGLPDFISGFVRTVDQRTYSQELQFIGDFGALDITSGIVLYRENLTTDRLSWRQNSFSYIKSRNVAENAGIYVQADYAITEKLTATAGIRLSVERRKMDSAANASNVNGEILQPIYSLEGLRETYRAALPKAALSYQWTPEFLSYVSFGVGQTTGGFNQASPTATVASIPVDPEKVYAYEFGNKLTFLDGRGFLTATFYYNDYRDYQASIANPILNGQVTAGTITVNAGDATIYGAEFELGGKITPRLDTRLSVSILRSEFDSFLNPTGAANTDYVGQDLAFAPEFSIGGSATYTQPLPNGDELRLNATVSHESSSYSEITTVRELTKFPRQTYVHGSIAYTTADGDWTFSLTAKNLLGKDYRIPIAGGYSPAGGYLGFISNYPRQVVFRVRRDF